MLTILKLTCSNYNKQKDFKPKLMDAMVANSNYIELELKDKQLVVGGWLAVAE